MGQGESTEQEGQEQQEYDEQHQIQQHDDEEYQNRTEHRLNPREHSSGFGAVNQHQEPNGASSSHSLSVTVPSTVAPVSSFSPLDHDDSPTIDQLQADAAFENNEDQQQQNQNEETNEQQHPRLPMGSRRPSEVTQLSTSAALDTLDDLILPNPPVEVVENGIGDLHLDLWYGIVEWVSGSLSSDVVLAWDSEQVGQRVMNLTIDPNLLRTLSKKQEERKRTRLEQRRKREEEMERQEDRQQIDGEDGSTPVKTPGMSNSAPPSPSAANSSIASPQLLPPSLSVPYDLASALLQVDSVLSRFRHTWVPARVSEDTFWDVYFNYLLISIRSHVLSLQQPEEQLQDTNPHLEEFIQKEKLKEQQQQQQAIPQQQ